MNKIVDEELIDRLINLANVVKKIYLELGEKIKRGSNKKELLEIQNKFNLVQEIERKLYLTIPIENISYYEKAIAKRNLKLIFTSIEDIIFKKSFLVPEVRVLSYLDNLVQCSNYYNDFGNKFFSDTVSFEHMKFDIVQNIAYKNIINKKNEYYKNDFIYVDIIHNLFYSLPAMETKRITNYIDPNTLSFVKVDDEELIITLDKMASLWITKYTNDIRKKSSDYYKSEEFLKEQPMHEIYINIMLDMIQSRLVFYYYYDQLKNLQYYSDDFGEFFNKVLQNYEPYGSGINLK